MQFLPLRVHRRGSILPDIVGASAVGLSRAAELVRGEPSSLQIVGGPLTRSPCLRRDASGPDLDRAYAGLTRAVVSIG